MDIYVARQPIFNRNQKVIGYELLHRSGLTNSYDGTDGTEASLAVIGNTLLVPESADSGPADSGIHQPDERSPAQWCCRTASQQIDRDRDPRRH